MREYVVHRSRFSGYHRTSLLIAGSLAVALDALRQDRPEDWLAWMC